MTDLCSGASGSSPPGSHLLPALEKRAITLIVKDRNKLFTNKNLAASFKNIKNTYLNFYEKLQPMAGLQDARGCTMIG